MGIKDKREQTTEIADFGAQLRKRKLKAGRIGENIQKVFIGHPTTRLTDG